MLESYGNGVNAFRDTGQMHFDKMKSEWQQLNETEADLNWNSFRTCGKWF